MNRPARAILAAGAIGAAGWLAWSPASAYVKDRRELLGQIGDARSAVERFRRAGDERPAVEARLRGYAARTLGRELETADHELRSRLNRVGEDLGLEALSVSTGRARNLESPARSVFRGGLREEIDAVEMEASIAGQGSLEQVLRLVHRVQSLPWLKRVDEVRLQPRDQGRRFAVTVRMRTLFLPGHAPDAVAEPLDDPASFAPYQALLARSPFEVPAKPAPPPAPPAPGDAGKPSFPYSRWVLTGVAEGPGGAEVWLRDTESGETRSVAVGSGFHELVLVSARGEACVFRSGDAAFTVTVGDRLPVPAPRPQSG